MSDLIEKSDARRNLRRGFLKGALVAGGAAAVAQSANATTALTEDAPDVEAKPETTAKYTETEHVRTYYRLARF